MQEMAPHNGSPPSAAKPAAGLTGDLWGGLAAMLVALPSAIAFGVTIYAPLGGGYAAQGAVAGLLGATVLGLVATAFGGTQRMIDRHSLQFFFTPTTRLDSAVIVLVILTALFVNLIAASGVGRGPKQTARAVRRRRHPTGFAGHAAFGPAKSAGDCGTGIHAERAHHQGWQKSLQGRGDRYQPAVYPPGRFEIQRSHQGKDHYHLTTVGQRDALGSMGFLAHEGQTAEALAVTDAEIYALPAAGLATLAEQHPGLALTISKHLTEQLASYLRVSLAEIQALRG